ncbi:hypothetical protein GCS57_002775, partial [Vibrio cholerae]
MSEEVYSNNKVRLAKRVIVIVTLISTLATLLFWLVFFQWITSPSFLKYTNLADAVTLTDPQKLTDPYILYTIGELVKDGTLISIEEVWAFQSSFYQTIITFLIAINGLIGALAFVFIKSSSNDKAQEAAVLHSKTYIESTDFNERVSNQVQQHMPEMHNRISQLQSEYSEAIKKLEEAEWNISTRNEEFDRLHREQQELKRHIN